MSSSTDCFSAGEVVERPVEEGVDLVVLLPEDVGVVGIGGHALQAGRQQLLQAGDVLSELLLAAQDADLLALLDQAVEAGGRLPGSGAAQHFGRLAGLLRGLFVSGLQALAYPGRLAQERSQSFGIEVDVGDGTEQRLEREYVSIVVGHAELARPVRVHPYALGCVYQEVLKGGRACILSAHPHDRTPDALGCLLALVAEHLRALLDCGSHALNSLLLVLSHSGIGRCSRLNGLSADAYLGQIHRHRLSRLSDCLSH